MGGDMRRPHAGKLQPRCAAFRKKGRLYSLFRQTKKNDGARRMHFTPGGALRAESSWQSTPRLLDRRNCLAQVYEFGTKLLTETLMQSSVAVFFRLAYSKQCTAKKVCGAGAGIDSSQADSGFIAVIMAKPQSAGVPGDSDGHDRKIFGATSGVT